MIGLVLGFPIVILGITLSASLVATILISAAVLVAGIVMGVLFKPKTAKSIQSADLSALQQALNPDAYRIAVLGRAPGGNDERYWEVFNTNSFDQIIAIATHEVYSFKEFYIEGKQVTFSGFASTSLVDASGGSSAYTPLIKTNTPRGDSTFGLAGTGAGVLWTTAASFTGCSYYRLHWGDTRPSVMPNGVPNRTVQVVEGALVYDPRKDGSQGGTGAHRANDRSTWEYSPTDSNGVPIGRNNALQLLWYLLGWKITSPQTAEQILVFGRGVDPDDINYPNWIIAANACETAQFYTDVTLSSGDSHSTNEALIAAGAQGMLLDNGGLWSYFPAVDDTATIAVAFTDADVVGGVKWTPKTNIGNTFNQIGGTFIDPSLTSVYQPQPYPVIKDSTYLTEDNSMAKRQTLDFKCVQSAALAQKLARIALNRGRLSGQFTATFNYKALQAENYNCVTLTFSPLGFTTKLFRVVSMAINPTSGIDLVLQEELSSVYTGGSVTSYVAPTASNSTGSNVYATRNQTFTQGTDPSSTYEIHDGDFWIITGGNTYIRNGGSWVLLASQIATLADNTLWFSKYSGGSFSQTVPSNNPGFCRIRGWGGGGAGDAVANGGTNFGGFSGAYFDHHLAVTPGTTVFGGSVGGGGQPGYSYFDPMLPGQVNIGPTSGSATTVSTGATLTANGGHYGVSGAAAATASGGSLFNTSGNAGTSGKGAGAPSGGADVTTAGANGSSPGGGGAQGTAGVYGGVGADGAIEIYARTT